MFSIRVVGLVVCIIGYIFIILSFISALFESE